MSKTFAGFPSPGFKGNVIRPGDEAYDAAREIPNARWENFPALIAQCRDEDDILLAVRYCVANKEPIAIRSGGHSIDGHAMPKDAFVIDTTLMKRIDVDPATGITLLESGVLLDEMDAATQKHGYVIPSGTVSATGAAGLTLGGGLGYLTRRFGMSVDHLLSVEVITMDGRKLHVSATENSDLFWGLRGAGHNLAIATSFTFQAQKVGPDAISGLIIYPIQATVPVLSQIDKAMAAAPRELCVYPVVLPAPPLPGLPPPMTGVPIFVLIIVYTGEAAKYEDAMQPLRPLAQPLADMVHPSSWMEANSILDVLAPPGRRQHSRGGYLGAMTSEIAELVVEHVSKAPAPTGQGPSVAVAFPCLGGANLDVDEDSMAYSRNGATWLWEVLGQWDPVDKDEEYIGWVDGVMDGLAPHSLSNAYVNLSTDRGAEWLRNLYGSREKWDRICALKEKYDPENMLSYNKNITRAQKALGKQ